MPTLATYKSMCLDRLHRELFPVAKLLYYDKAKSPQEKSPIMNAAVNAARRALAAKISPSEPNAQALHVTLEYCVTVVMLEYRNMVWPYNNLDLSRRVGELWEQICKAAWTYSTSPDLRSLHPPSFEDIKESFRIRMSAMTMPGMESTAEVMLDQMLGLVGDVNMACDGVYTHEGSPLAIDFKGGFKSNEKGNTERLLRVGRAYRIWNPDSRLLLLVRETRHNNYLKKIKEDGIWDVRLGRDAYKAMTEIMHLDIEAVFSEIVDFETDLSERFWQRLEGAGPGLKTYLDWRI